MVIADDQSWSDFGFMGNGRVSTPNLDALARRSALFRNGYVPSSVCRPSLVTMLTGLYPFQHGVHFNHGPPGNAGYNRMTSQEAYEAQRNKEFALLAKCKTLPQMLRQRGYRSLQTGKFWEGHWRNGGFTEGMTTFKAPSDEQTFGGVRTLANGQRVAHGNGDAGLLIGRKTLQPIYDFIDDCGKQPAPWLVWYAPYLPHQPHDSPRKFYEQARMAGARAHELPYYASIAQFDHTVGQLVDFLQKRDELRSTVIVFLADNGWKPSKTRQKGRREEFAHSKRSKRAPFDDGVRTPIFLHWEAKIPAKTYEAPVSSVDLVPTLLSLTQASEEQVAKQPLPGVDLGPVLEAGAEPPHDRPIFGEIYPGDASSLTNPDADIAYRWVRQAQWKLIAPHSHSPAPPWGGYLDEISLFDVMADPNEQQNLAAMPSYEMVKDRLLKLLEQWRPITRPSSP